MTKIKDSIKTAGNNFKLYAGRLEKLGIFTIEDLILHIPSRYQDFSLISKIDKLQVGETVTIQGSVKSVKNIFTKSRKQIQEIFLKDETGEIKLLWFNQPFITKTIQANANISVSGKVDKENGKLILISPEYEIIFNNNPTIHTGKIIPIYPETKGVSSKWLRRQIYKKIDEFKDYFQEYLPLPIIKSNDFISLNDAIKQIHFPDTLAQSISAKNRLAFDELFLLQLLSMQKRKEWKKHTVGNPFSIKKFEKEIDTFWKKLSFVPTKAQVKVINDICNDLIKEAPMNRLIQGDVGSGKTVVAAITMYIAFLNGYKSVLMAPTEILAQQHFKTISELLTPLGAKVELRTGSNKSSQKLTKSLATNYNLLTTDILIGTHAVLSDSVKLKKIGLIVIDEQHRFGVSQRAQLKEKGENPHLLTMTATPIPRTVALTMYGDLDLSVIDEMPKNRKKIKTWLVPNNKRDAAYAWIEKQITENKDQVFIVCPFIEESESMTTVKAAKKEFESLQKNIFPKHKLGLLHGKLKQAEKDQILQDFRDKKIDILIATPVVEVGLDIPNATIIVIEASERFGLASLHQLRGRVGRGDKQSYCLLFTQSQSLQTKNRLLALEKIHNGAELSELDLKLRGSGDIYGTIQSGYRMLKIASFSDFKLIEKARNAALEIFPRLTDYPSIVNRLKITSTKLIAQD